MERRSTADRFVHFGGDVVSNVESSHGVSLSGGSTGGLVEPLGDDTNVSLIVRAKNTGLLTIGNSSNRVDVAGSSLNFNSTQIRLGSTASSIVVGNSTSFLTGIQRYLVQYTVPAMSSGPFATESTVTVTGLTTNSVLMLQNRLINNSTGQVSLHARCSTANELTIQFVSNDASTLSGSTQSAYLLQFLF